MIYQSEDNFILSVMLPLYHFPLQYLSALKSYSFLIIPLLLIKVVSEIMLCLLYFTNDLVPSHQPRKASFFFFLQICLELHINKVTYWFYIG